MKPVSKYIIVRVAFLVGVFFSSNSVFIVSRVVIIAARSFVMFRIFFLLFGWNAFVHFKFCIFARFCFFCHQHQVFFLVLHVKKIIRISFLCMSF